MLPCLHLKHIHIFLLFTLTQAHDPEARDLSADDAVRPEAAPEREPHGAPEGPAEHAEREGGDAGGAHEGETLIAPQPEFHEMRGFHLARWLPGTSAAELAESGLDESKVSTFLVCTWTPQAHLFI